MAEIVRGRHNRTKGEESESGEGEQVDILSVLARERVAVAVKETLPLGLLLLYTLLLLSRFLQRRVQLLTTTEPHTVYCRQNQ